MEIYLLSDIKGIGIKGEIVKVKEGYADNFIIPRKMGVKVTAKNSEFYNKKAVSLKDRKKVINSNTSILAEKIKGIKLTLKRKMHDDGKLYAAINASEIASLLAKEGINIKKNQVDINKSIKTKGLFSVDIKLTSKIQSKVELKVTAEQ